MAWTGAWRRGRRIAGGALEWTWLLALAVFRLGLSFIAATLGLLVFAKIAREVFQGETQAFDESVVNYFATHQPAWLHVPVRAITYLANWEAIAIVSTSAFLYFAIKRKFGRAITLAIAVLGGWGLIEGLKALFARPRPEVNSIAETGLSFPSGHAFFSLTLYGLLAYFLAREAPWRLKGAVWTAVFSLAILVGISRVLLGVHYPSDVAGGFCVGAFWLWGCLKLPSLFAWKSWGEWRRERLSALASARQDLSSLGEAILPLEEAAESALAGRQLRRSDRLYLRGSLTFSKLYRRSAARLRFLRRYPIGSLPLGSALARAERHGLTVPKEAHRLSAAARVLLGDKFEIA